MYSISRPRRSAAGEIFPWASVILGLLLIGTGWFKMVRREIILSTCIPVRARVVSFESHGYPVPTENWLRFEVLEGRAKGVAVALQVPPGVSLYKPDDIIVVYHGIERGVTRLNQNAFFIADPRQSGDLRWESLLLGLGMFSGGLTIFIKRRKKSNTIEG